MDKAIDAARAARGKELHAHRWVVEEGHVRQFRRATRTDGRTAAAPDEVPICFTVTAGLWGVPHTDLLEDLGMDLGRVVHGEQLFEIFTPLEIGREYTVRQRVADVTVKSGRRAGRMLIVAVETTIEDTGGVLCVRDLHSSIQTER